MVKKDCIMRKAFAISLLAILVLAGCQVNEIVEEVPLSMSFTATIEDNFDGAETRTSLDENGNVRWKQGDQISIFAGSTINEQYQVTDDSDGKTSASIIKVTGSGFVGGGEIDNNIAFYPYASTAEIAKNSSTYVISDINLPSVQYFAESSFGNGAFPMVAVTNTTDDMHLKFKNVLGGLKLQLTGTASIKSINVTGNSGEILCGAAKVTVSNSDTPSINLTDETATTVMLDCGEGVQLNEETATPFVIALPPMTMSAGFTVVITDTEGKEMEIKTTKSQTINRSNLLKMPAVNFVGVRNNPLKFKSTGTTSISLIQQGSPNAISLEYKVSDGAWTNYTLGQVIDLADGEDVSFRAGPEGNASFSMGFNDYYQFFITGTGTVAASGIIMYLLDQNVSSASLSAFCFYRLFYSCTNLTAAPELPATKLAERCYSSMFSNCTSLTAAPELPATTVFDYCYDSMFYGCTSLTAAPGLPATTLAQCCYLSMFRGCTSLIAAPELPATTLANNCYSNMFQGCTYLTAAPELPATTLFDYCYSSMFSNCTSLTAAPGLPATTLAMGCYEGMFFECTNLTTAPELPATTLFDYCYSSMFSNCTSLTSVPGLPATTLAQCCYLRMFQGCTSLIAAPELPATTLANNCYGFMFSDCTSLTSVPGLPSTKLANHCYQRMFEGCTSLTSAPELPATTLANYCYLRMFRGCTSLTSAPELPATTLAMSCYSSMFYDCTSLTSTSKVLPATNLKSNCYHSMFYGCTSLTSAPELPATTLVYYCYQFMFHSCSSLSYIKMLAIDASATNCLAGWVYNVAPTGTFVKNVSAAWGRTGEDGIPSGWTVITE